MQEPMLEVGPDAGADVKSETGPAVEPAPSPTGPSFNDPLLSCLSLATALHDDPIHSVALGSGFARQANGCVVPKDLPEIALRHGFVATWVEVTPIQMTSFMLPAIVPLTDGSAIVVCAIAEGIVRFLAPSSGLGECEIALTELEILAEGHILLIKPRIRADERTLVPMAGKAANWFWGTLWRFRGFYYESMLATVIANVLTLAGVFFSMNVYDRVVPTQAYASLWTLAIGTTVATLLEFVMRWLRARLIDIGGKKADLVINATLFREIMSIRLEHRPQSIGAFTSSMRDFDSLRDFFSSASLVAITDLPFVFLFVAMIAVVAGPLAWVPLVTVPLVIGLGLLAQPWLTTAMREHMRESSERQSILIESLLNLETVKANNAEPHFQRRWEDYNRLAADSYHKTRSLTNLMMGFTTTIQQLVTIIIIVWGVYLIHENKLTQGGLIAAVILAGRAIGPLASIMGLASRYQQAKMALETLDGLMKRPRERAFEQKYLNPPVIQGALQINDVEFSYPGELKIPRVRKISLNLPAGHKIALLGRVGSGKSTLLRLVSGLYTADSGTVNLDGLDMRQIDPTVLRRHIGYLGQDSQLFLGTLRENLVLSDGWITDARIIEVLQALELYPMVAAHPRGLDMQLSEGGVGLSGGQMQLVSIARMMLRSPSVVMLDEPTSAMDQNTEARVIQVLGNWLQSRTLVLVTHRPQLLVWVNRIGVIDSGQLVAEGPKDEMIERLSRGLSVAPAGAGPATANPSATKEGPRQ